MLLLHPLRDACVAERLTERARAAAGTVRARDQADALRFRPARRNAGLACVCPGARNTCLEHTGGWWLAPQHAAAATVSHRQYGGERRQYDVSHRQYVRTRASKNKTKRVGRCTQANAACFAAQVGTFASTKTSRHARAARTVRHEDPGPRTHTHAASLRPRSVVRVHGPVFLPPVDHPWPLFSSVASFAERIASAHRVT